MLSSLPRCRLSSRSLSSSFLKCDPALVIFDKDGTLIDFDLMWGGWVESNAWKLEMTSKLPVREKLFDAMGYDWMKRSIRSSGAMCCTPMHELNKIAVKVIQAEGLTEEKSRKIVDSVWHMPDPVASARPLADVKGIFHTLKKMNIKIAVCTTDDREPTIATLKHMEVLDMVDALGCGDDPIPSKPSPDQVYAICRELGVEPYNTIMVGDTNTDMQLGRNANVGLTIGVLGGASSLKDLSKEADVLIPSLEKVIRILFQYGQQARRRDFFYPDDTEPEKNAIKG